MTWGLDRKVGMRRGSKVPLRMCSPRTHKPAFAALPSRLCHQQDTSAFYFVAYFSCPCWCLDSFIFENERGPDWLNRWLSAPDDATGLWSAYEWAALVRRPPPCSTRSCESEQWTAWGRAPAHSVLTLVPQPTILPWLMSLCPVLLWEMAPWNLQVRTVQTGTAMEAGSQACDINPAKSLLPLHLTAHHAASSSPQVYGWTMRSNSRNGRVNKI